MEVKCPKLLAAVLWGGVIPAGCQLEEKKHKDDEFNANT